MTELVLKRFEKPDVVKKLDKGRFEMVSLPGVSIGRATCKPGWRWSEHVGKAMGLTECQVEHVGMVVSGRAMVAMSDGAKVEIRAGDVFHIAPGHDSWVVGNGPYVSFHFSGTEDYSKHW